MLPGTPVNKVLKAELLYHLNQLRHAYHDISRALKPLVFLEPRTSFFTSAYGYSMSIGNSTNTGPKLIKNFTYIAKFIWKQFLSVKLNELYRVIL
jgi:hypothetical protein